MSYDKTVDGLYNVTFRDEKSYLNCRLDYLNWGGHTTPGFEISFLEFIQQEKYSKDKCEVEDVEPQQISSWVPTEGSFAVGNDSGNMYVSSFANSYTSEITEGQVVHINGNLIVSGEIISGTNNNIVGTTIGQADTNSDVYYNASYTIVPVDHPLKGSSKESIPETPPSDLIKHRWEILDIRGEDNEHD